MKLVEVEIFDFKSIKHEKIDLNVNQLCFVGINECGKSSIIEAISYLNILDKEMSVGLFNKSSKKYPTGLPVICGLFEFSHSEFQSFSDVLEFDFNVKMEINIPKTIRKVIQVKRWGNGLSNISLIFSDLDTYSFDITKIIEKDKSFFFDKFFTDFYPIIELYKDEDLLIEPATIDDLKGTDKKFETFRRLLHIGGCQNFDILNDEDFNTVSTFLFNINVNLNKIFKKHYKQDDSIELNIASVRNKFSIVIRDNSEKGFSIDERSPGFRYYFAFLVNKLYMNSINENKNIIYLLDEPGNNLHPKGAKDLLKTFEDIASKNQILYTTHNPFLAIRNDIDSLIFVQKCAEKGTKINRKPYLSKYQMLRKELGILLNDSFLIGDINLIVEGNTEKLALHRLFHNENFTELQWLNIYNADGVTNISQTLNYLGKNNLNLSGIALLDSDGEATDEKKKSGFTKAMKEKNWDYIEINNVFNNDGKDRTFEDLFPQDLYIESYNEYCRSLIDIGVFDKEFINFTTTKEIETPIINNLTKHFFSFITEERKKENSITKQDIIRILLDKTEKLDGDFKGRILVNVFKLISLIQVKVKKIS